MSTPPATKRRRVDSLGIHKPFVSPLKRNSAPCITTSSTPAPLRSQPTPVAPYTPLRSSNLKLCTPATSQDPETAKVQKEIKALESRIRDLRAQNGVLDQAAQITTPSSQASSTPSSQQQQQQQPRLIRLSHKWLLASQLAAEEVFTSFSQSIHDNGGYTAFLAQQKRRSQSSTAFFNDEQPIVDSSNEENWRDEQGDELTERGKRQRRDMIEGNAYNIQKEQEGEEQEEEQEEQELTIGVMLQILNIDPEVIGWDTQTLAWKA